MMKSPDRRKSVSDKPRIWATGGQRPPFELRAFSRAALFLSRTGVAPLLAWLATRLRRAAVAVAGGSGRIPEARLGRAARFVPSHLRVASWLGNLAAVLAHASANADPDVTRGNSLVARIGAHLWPEQPVPPMPAAAEMNPSDRTAPVVLPEPLQPGDDPLRDIRADMETADVTTSGTRPEVPPAPPGQLASAAIQVSGYLLGWTTSLIALPYGLGLALFKHIKGEDLRKVGRED